MFSLAHVMVRPWKAGHTAISHSIPTMWGKVYRMITYMYIPHIYLVCTYVTCYFVIHNPRTRTRKVAALSEMYSIHQTTVRDVLLYQVHTYMHIHNQNTQTSLCAKAKVISRACGRAFPTTRTRFAPRSISVSYTHLTLPTILRV